MLFEEKKDNCLNSTDKMKLNVKLIRDFLCSKSYRTAGITPGIRNPDVCLTKPKRLNL